MFQPSVAIPELIFRVALVYAGVFLLLRVAGKRHVGELAPFDLVVLLILSECVQNALIGDDKVRNGRVDRCRDFVRAQPDCWSYKLA